MFFKILKWEGEKRVCERDKKDKWQVFKTNLCLFSSSLPSSSSLSGETEASRKEYPSEMSRVSRERRESLSSVFLRPLKRRLCHFYYFFPLFNFCQFLFLERTFFFLLKLSSTIFYYFLNCVALVATTVERRRTNNLTDFEFCRKNGSFSRQRERERERIWEILTRGRKKRRRLLACQKMEPTPILGSQMLKKKHLYHASEMRV